MKKHVWTICFAAVLFAFTVYLALVLGVLPSALLLFRGTLTPRAAALLWNYGIAALSVGCVFRGVLEIYGTTNSLRVIYPIAGAALLTAAFIVWLSKRRFS